MHLFPLRQGPCILDQLEDGTRQDKACLALWRHLDVDRPVVEPPGNLSPNAPYFVERTDAVARGPVAGGFEKQARFVLAAMLKGPLTSG